MSIKLMKKETRLEYLQRKMREVHTRLTEGSEDPDDYTEQAELQGELWMERNRDW